MFVSDFLNGNKDRFPTDFLDCLPEKCPDSRCGCRMQMTAVLTDLECSNPRCPSKVDRRVLNLARMIDIPDFTLREAREFTDYYQVQNPLMLFAYTAEGTTFGANVSMERSEKIAAVIEAHRDMTLAEYVRYAGIPYLKDSIDLLFGGKDSLDAVYQKIETGGVDYILGEIGIMSSDATDVSARAVMVYAALEQYKYDLYEALSYIRLEA